MMVFTVLICYAHPFLISFYFKNSQCNQLPYNRFVSIMTDIAASEGYKLTKSCIQKIHSLNLVCTFSVLFSSDQEI